MHIEFIELTDPIYVKRDNPASRQETLRQIKLRAKYEKIAIFPEGTCTNRSSIIKFRLGAFTSGLPVQPIFIDYAKGSKLKTLTIQMATNRILNLCLIYNFSGK